MKLPAIPPVPAGVLTIATVVLASLGVTDTNEVTAIKTTVSVIGGLAVLAYNYEFHKTKRNQATAAASIRRPIVIAPVPSDPAPVLPAPVPVAATAAALLDSSADSSEPTL